MIVSLHYKQKQIQFGDKKYILKNIDMIEINEKFLKKDLKKHTDEELKELLDFHYFIYEKVKQEMRRRLNIITK